MGDDNEVKNIIADQLKKTQRNTVRKRKTTLISGEEITEYNETENIDDYPLTIFVTEIIILRRFQPYHFVQAQRSIN